MRSFREFLLIEATAHAYDQMEKRLLSGKIRDGEKLLRTIRSRVEDAEQIYNDGTSWAIIVMVLPEYVQMTLPDDGSNGDWVVAIIRPSTVDSRKANCITVMFRRSPNMPDMGQDLEPLKIRVDKTVPPERFEMHLSGYRATGKTIEDWPPTEKEDIRLKPTRPRMKDNLLRNPSFANIPWRR
jgi:hypothetical protein